MAKRARKPEVRLTSLVVELNQLNSRRETVIEQINRVIQTMVGGDIRRVGSRAVKPARRRRRGGRPKGFKMSEATKAKLRAAWKRRKAGAGK